MSEHLGLTGAVSMALGGMIGGGIYAVLGVVAGLTGAATWFAFGVAGAVALCAAYSYLTLRAYHLYRSKPGTFYGVLVIAAAVVAVELLYFERDVIEEEIQEVERAVEGAVEGAVGAGGGRR